MSTSESYYDYTPSVAAAGIFVALFSITGLVHLYKTVTTRTWFCIPLVVGALCTSVRSEEDQRKHSHTLSHPCILPLQNHPTSLPNYQPTNQPTTPKHALTLPTSRNNRLLRPRPRKIILNIPPSLHNAIPAHPPRPHSLRRNRLRLPRPHHPRSLRRNRLRLPRPHHPRHTFPFLQPNPDDMANQALRRRRRAVFSGPSRWRWCAGEYQDGVWG